MKTLGEVMNEIADRMTDTKIPKIRHIEKIKSLITEWAEQMREKTDTEDSADTFYAKRNSNETLDEMLGKEVK